MALKVFTILPELRSSSAERTPLLPLRFWPLQCIGWLGLALATFPMKLYFFDSISAALQVTLMREGLGFVLTTLARQIWKHYWKDIDRRPVRQILLVIALALCGAVIDLLLLLLAGHKAAPAVMLNPSFQIVSFGYRALILSIWGLLYFGLKGIQARQQLAAAIQEAELRMLRTQICPHLLFNALNTMLACARKEPEALPPLIHSLAGCMRYSLRNHDATCVPLREEYQAVLDYLTIEKARFREDLQIDAHLQPEAASVTVPGILLQPLVENAVKHGRATSARPLHIRIGITLPTPEQLEIRIANSGHWNRPDPGHGFGIGLKNLRQRLELFYPQSEPLSVTDADGWVSVVIRLPVRSKG